VREKERRERERERERDKRWRGRGAERVRDSRSDARDTRSADVVRERRGGRRKIKDCET
jgi:hypothetical protein